ncbi:MAG: type I restriction enzyme HsdR N-terminal domain-containing protein [Nitrospiraceae bacterium]|nr:type I restriction enzyme HsdR N-terminal domain-containing protein [Nitrospiraceae bacterium]
MNEAETRAEHIDPALRAAGWGVVEGSRIRREYPITLGRLEGSGRRGKPLTADYLLEYRNTKLAIIETKAWEEELTEGVAQAKNYAEKLAVRFAYATNGQGIYRIDMSPDSLPPMRLKEKYSAFLHRTNSGRSHFLKKTSGVTALQPFLSKTGAAIFRDAIIRT